MDKLTLTLADLHEIVDFIIKNGIQHVSPLVTVQAVRQNLLGMDWKDFLIKQNQEARDRRMAETK